MYLLAKLKNNAFSRWLQDDEGLAAVEFVFIFPILMVMLVGVFELGTAITINQKAISSSQMMADLLSRNRIVDDDMVDMIVVAGERAMLPYAIDVFGVDIISITFDEDDNPEVVWRDTRNMDPSTVAMDRAVGLGTEGDGAIIVAVNYRYTPSLGRIFVDGYDMEEISYSRSRNVAVLPRED